MAQHLVFPALERVLEQGDAEQLGLSLVFAAYDSFLIIKKLTQDLYLDDFIWTFINLGPA